MIFEKVVSEGLAHNSYVVGSAGEAAVIDPRRDCDIYLHLSVEHNVKITHLFETHRNEDYVVGSVELSHMTGAGIYHGSHMDFAYGNSVTEGDTFDIGNLCLEILETPGHTKESISITLTDTDTDTEEVYMVFTGDALFAGDVGRTDFFPGEEEQMAEALYDSLFTTLLPLGDGVIVCPAHGAGSVCGAELSEHEFTTIGYEKKTNPALQMSKKEFVAYKTQEVLYTPPYFERMEVYNKEGPPLLHGPPYVPPLSVKDIKSCKNAQILDVRNPTSYAGGHIPGSINIWKDGLPLFAGWMLAYENPIIIVDESNQQLKDIIRYLVRIGYDNLLGYLAGGFATWYKNAQPTERVDTWSVHELMENRETDIYLLDVREISQWKKDGYIQGAHRTYVGELEDHLDKIPHTHVVVYCDSGFKTGIATSILKSHGYESVTGVLGGMIAWKKAGYPLEKA